MERLVNVYRGDFLESFHFGSVAVVDSAGRLLAWAGDPTFETFIRSTAKPFQAIPLMLEGGGEEFDLAPEEVALICASHGGEPKHVATAAALLRKGEFDESDLLCGLHTPFDEKVAAELKQSGESPTPLHNNCSGKHAGMLLATRIFDFPSADYNSPDHPLQQRITEVLASFAGLSPDEVGVAMDGCSVPSYFLSLYRSAFAFARLMAVAHGNGVEELGRYQDAAKEIVDAMTGHPDYVAGAWSMTTPLMQEFGGKLLSKEGAEGFYAMALDPSLSAPILERLHLAEGPAIGITLKVADGSMSRGRDAAVMRTLDQLGVHVDSAKLAGYRERQLFNLSGRPVGRVKSEFDLKFL